MFRAVIGRSDVGFLNVHALAEFGVEKMKKVALFATEHMFCDQYCLEPGQSQKVHAHDDATKLYYVLDGAIEATVGAETRTLQAGDLAFAEPGEIHGITNRSNARARVLVVMGPNPNL